MSSRVAPRHIVSTSAPVNAALGDEWFNPTTNTLSKFVIAGGTTVSWIAIPLSNTLNMDIANVHISGGSNGQVIYTDGAGNLGWKSAASGSGGGGGASASVAMTMNFLFGG